MNVSEVYHRCDILKKRYPFKVKRPVFEDKGKYIALSQLVSKMHHECIMNENDSLSAGTLT